MDAAPWLRQVETALAEAGLESVPIDSAATGDLRFVLPRTPRNTRKLRKLAARLGVGLWQSIHPVSGMLRVFREEDGLQLTFVPTGQSMHASKDARLLTPPVASLPKVILNRKVTRKRALAALKVENERAILEMIRGRLALPMEKRTHFLRRRVGFRATAL